MRSFEDTHGSGISRGAPDSNDWAGVRCFVEFLGCMSETRTFEELHARCLLDLDARLWRTNIVPDWWNIKGPPYWSPKILLHTILLGFGILAGNDQFVPLGPCIPALFSLSPAACATGPLKPGLGGSSVPTSQSPRCIRMGVAAARAIANARWGNAT